jgi:hypothetical protein
MDVDVASRRNSERVFGEEELIGSNGKIRIGGDVEGEGFCRPGDEDCG